MDCGLHEIQNRKDNMKFNAHQYFRAATGHQAGEDVVWASDDDGRAIAMYTAGVAVECLFRAFKLMRSAELMNGMTCCDYSPKAECYN